MTWLYNEWAIEWIGGEKKQHNNGHKKTWYQVVGRIDARF